MFPAFDESFLSNIVNSFNSNQPQANDSFEKSSSSKDIIGVVASFLTKEELSAASQLNRKFNQVANRDNLWVPIAQKAGITPAKPNTRQNLIANLRQQQAQAPALLPDAPNLSRNIAAMANPFKANELLKSYSSDPDLAYIRDWKYEGFFSRLITQITVKLGIDPFGHMDI